METKICSKCKEEKELLSEIIERINSVYGLDLRDEDKVDIENVEKRISEHDDMRKVMNGNNTEDVKQEFFDKLLRDTFLPKPR